jgi:2'-5' RNA ligase
MKKRVFIALPISKNLKIKIEKWRDEFIKLPVRFIPAENLHITLVPPWYEENVKKVINKLEDPHFARKIKGRLLPLSIHLKKARLAPSSSQPRLIWLEGETPQALLELKKEIEKILNKKPEKRNFLLHVTIARVKKEEEKRLKHIGFEKEIDWKDSIESIALLESHLEKTGAVYKILKEIKFS